MIDNKILPIFIEGYYCDKQGNIYSEKSFHPPKKSDIKILKPKIQKNGYAVIGLIDTRKENKGNRKRTFLVHRIILASFSNKPYNYYLHCNHKNGIRNDNRFDNLEWVTRSENEKHAIHVLGKNIKGENHSLCKFTDIQIQDMRDMRKSGSTLKEISEKFNISITHVQRIVNMQSRV